MSKNNLFLPLFLAMALGGAGPADVLAAIQPGAEMQDRTLFRLVTDRLSVLYLMAGRTDDAVKLQKETMGMAGRPVPVDLVRSRGEELITLLDEDFKEAEVAKFREKFREAGIEIGSPSAAVSAPAPAVPEPAVAEVAKPVEKAVAKAEDRPASKAAPAAVPVVEEETVVVRRDPAATDEQKMAVVKVKRQRTADASARPAPAPRAVSPAPVPTSVPETVLAPAARVVSPDTQPVQSAAARAKPAAVPVKLLEEETVTVEEEAAPPAEPKRAVVKVRRIQTPLAPPPTAPAPAVATAAAKIAKKVTLSVPRSMIVPVPKKPKAPSQPLFPKKVQPGPVAVPDPDQPVKAVSLAPKRDNALRDLSNIKVSLEFRDVQLADLVRLLANKANLNMVSKNPISGQTTVNFQDIPIGTALDTVLKTNGYSYEVRDGVVWVYRVGEEPLETRVFFLRHAMAYEILPLVENTIS